MPLIIRGNNWTLLFIGAAEVAQWLKAHKSPLSEDSVIPALERYLMPLASADTFIHVHIPTHDYK